MDNYALIETFEALDDLAGKARYIVANYEDHGNFAPTILKECEKILDEMFYKFYQENESQIKQAYQKIREHFYVKRNGKLVCEGSEEACIAYIKTHHGMTFEFGSGV